MSLRTLVRRTGLAFWEVIVTASAFVMAIRSATRRRSNRKHARANHDLQTSVALEPVKAIEPVKSDAPGPGLPPASAVPEESSTADWSTFLVRLSTALAVYGLIAVIAARVAYEAYYRNFGVTLDEVGLSPARLLTIGGLLVISNAGTSILGLTIILVFCWRIILRGDPRRSRLARTLANLTLLAGGLIIAFVPAVKALTRSSIGNSLGLTLGVVALISIFLPERVKATIRWLMGPYFAVLALGVVVIMGAYWSTVTRQANEAAESLGDDGNSTRGESAAAVLDVYAGPVCVTTVGGKPFSGVESAQLFLGGGDGTLVFLDVNASPPAVSRLPAEQTLIVDRYEDGTCPADEMAPDSGRKPHVRTSWPNTTSVGTAAACELFRSAYNRASREAAVANRSPQAKEAAHPISEADTWNSEDQAKLEKAAVVGSLTRPVDAHTQRLNSALTTAVAILDPNASDYQEYDKRLDLSNSRVAADAALQRLVRTC